MKRRLSRLVKFAARRSPQNNMNRILVIRGGAIGDFILTLPAIKLLAGRFSPRTH